MIKCSCLINDDSYKTEYAYTPEEYNFSKLDSELSNIHKKYLNMICTFDIESYTHHKELSEDYEGYMYHWQMCIDGDAIFGRTWEDFRFTIDHIKKALHLDPEKRVLVIWIHNLSYEYFFMRSFMKFDQVFATDTTSILRASGEGFELRCSYRLSNMSLRKFCENCGTYHRKGSGDLDYKKKRTPETVLTPKEYGYCFNDVMALYEAMEKKLKADRMDKIPMTSTGYVRRDVRRAVKKNKRNRTHLENTRLDAELYELLRECFRGGNTAANRYSTNEIIKDVHSYDISSSYPYVMIAYPEYPSTAFCFTTIKDEADLDQYNKTYCTMARYHFKGLKLKKHITIPYMPISKAILFNKEVCFNGRVLQADYIEMALTNIDYWIIKQQYDYDELIITDFWFATKGWLPKEIREKVVEYYYNKSILKHEDPYFYTINKEYLNSIYGMMVQRIIHDEFSVDDKGNIFMDNTKTDDEKINDYYNSRNSFLEYQWGVWVTALARMRLQKGIDAVGADMVYCDTDSVKCIGSHDQEFDAINAESIQKHAGIHRSVEYKGERYTMGTFERDAVYDKFITLGSKKYAYIEDGKLGITVAGLSKKQGAEELKKKGGLKAFRDGEVFLNSGRTCAYYNDDPVHEITVDGCAFTTGANIAIVDVTYTIGMTDEMISVLNGLQDDILEWEDMKEEK